MPRWLVVKWSDSYRKILLKTRWKFRNLTELDILLIGRIERGERNPFLEIAIRLVHYLKVPVEDIFQVED